MAMTNNYPPSFIPNTQLANPNCLPPPSWSHGQPCHHCNAHIPSPCRDNRQLQLQSQRQCHMHNQYATQCHACNTPRTQLATTSYAHCQCYRCQRSRREPVLHPAIGVPLAIATGGLSGAAMGIYRGVTIQRRAKKLRTAQTLGVSPGERGDVSTLEKEQIAKGGHAVPSPISAARPRPSPNAPSSNISELEAASALARRQSLAVSEIDSSPVEAAPPRYSEVVGTEVIKGVGEKM